LPIPQYYYYKTLNKREKERKKSGEKMQKLISKSIPVVLLVIKPLL
jgi:hypothetical protein